MEEKKSKVVWVGAKIIFLVLLPFLFVGIAIGMIWRVACLGFSMTSGIDAEAKFWETMDKKNGE